MGANEADALSNCHGPSDLHLETGKCGFQDRIRGFSPSAGQLPTDRDPKKSLHIVREERPAPQSVLGLYHIWTCLLLQLPTHLPSVAATLRHHLLDPSLTRQKYGLRAMEQTNRL